MLKPNISNFSIRWHGKDLHSNIRISFARHQNRQCAPSAVSNSLPQFLTLKVYVRIVSSFQLSPSRYRTAAFTSHSSLEHLIKAIKDGSICFGSKLSVISNKPWLQQKNEVSVSKHRRHAQDLKLNPSRYPCKTILKEHRDTSNLEVLKFHHYRNFRFL